MNEPSTDVKSPKPPRDWFGYILTAVIGLLVTIGATWYQLYSSDRQATAAEVERARAVRQSVIAIVEEQALNGKALAPDRISRLIDQRRREQSVSLPISTSDVVEQAEFNIASSSYLNVERKEQIKPIFDTFYSELASRSFHGFTPATPNSDLLNELAKQIQEGKTAPALANLKRLEELHSVSMAKLTKKAQPSILDAMSEFFGKPLNIGIFAIFYLFALRIVYLIRQRRKYPFGRLQ